MTESDHYFNRELSWLDFNERVLAEARDAHNPLLERANFLAITQSNLDEFFNVRVASLNKMLSVHYQGTDAAGLTAEQQLAAISVKAHEQVRQQYQTWQRMLWPRLKHKGIRLLKWKNLTSRQIRFLDHYFETQLYPVLTPLAVDVSRPFPFIANNTLNLAVTMYPNHPTVSTPHPHDLAFALVQVPDIFPRTIKLPGTEQDFILQEDVITHYLQHLFIGFTLHEIGAFRVTRDMDLDVADDDASDLMKEIEKQLQLRQHGRVMRLEVNATMSATLLGLLVHELELPDQAIYRIRGPINLSFIKSVLSQIEADPTLKYPTTEGYIPHLLRQRLLFDVIRERDIFLHHPYDSFTPVVTFIRQAAQDPQTLAIKMTLYRVSSRSPIIQYLKEAAQNGKQITVLVELKARFDEENNVHWANELEKAGCHVIYGLVGLKTHCKLALVVRREADGIRRYMHMATGNYNDVTAQHYTDMSLFTANVDMGIDASNIFNMLSGFSQPPYFHQLIIAPLGIRPFLMAQIEEQIQLQKHHQPAYIRMKMNSLSDTGMINKLYQAAQAGVKIDLLVRGICNLKPGVPGLSETVTVHSIVGRFLEHSRIYQFGSQDHLNLYLASADLMNRNLSRRVELLFPILDPAIREQIARIFDLMWDDTVKTSVLSSDGTWSKLKSAHSAHLDVQTYLLTHAAAISEALYEGTLPVKSVNPHTTFTPIIKSSDSMRGAQN